LIRPPEESERLPARLLVWQYDAEGCKKLATVILNKGKVP